MNKKLFKTIITVLVIILLLALATKIPFVGQFVADTLDKPIEVINAVVDMLVTVVVGLLLIAVAGTLLTAGAVLLGALVVVAGLALIAIGVFSFRGKKTKPQD